MEESITLARPYAQAAFEHASSSDSIDQWSDMLGLLSGVVADPQMRAIVADPRVSSNDLSALLLDIGGDRIDDAVGNFVRLLAENGRISSLPTIARLYEDARNREQGRSDVLVTSAFELEAKQIQMLTGALAKRLGREVQMSVEVDPDLIGGVVIRAGDVVIDASVKGKLRELANHML